MRQYVVRYGDSLWKIAKTELNNPSKWQEIASLNELTNPNHIMVGQKLILPGNTQLSSRPNTPTAKSTQPIFHNSGKEEATHFPVKCFLFMIADEVLPSMTTVRKIIVPNPEGLDPKLFQQISNPERFGFLPRNPNSKVSIGRHVLGMVDSPFISVSSLPKGSPRFEGTSYWINMDKVIKSGATIHDEASIIKDLERIAEKSANKAEFLKYIEEIKYKSSVIDKEMLIEGVIPANAVKGSLAKGLTTGFRVWTGVGVVVSVYDLSEATSRSYKEKSIKPLAAQTIREASGWGAAWAGARIGGSLGALVGIESGPGAVLTAAAGGLIFGVAGYFGAEWVASFLEKKEQ